LSCKVDILQHREEQIKAADARAGTLQQQLDKLQAEIAHKTEEIAKLKDANASQAERLEDAASIVSDKERLEDTVKKQVNSSGSGSSSSSAADFAVLKLHSGTSNSRRAAEAVAEALACSP
jgi:chromosome segregation ATPase